ncbi:DUF58 domain-containing protein [Lichenihabitans sp. PAMC28606]|uniref:DUF58 domain-containing protein n=1 Tax=Lichenihabitans sp. PAMC28606 TaxID=2880932 RepID=UPI001D0A3E62|nr:DUF58 domain-containing protein [Lichenihabitans sp. PAMC28606]UDL94644.1 DUF58 domain-containing protein [Lichenihabitans sp. PAMC28606]
MAQARLLADAQRWIGPRHGRGALDLAGRLPNLVVSAREIAGSMMQGVHGRRRAGTGESFWQFRSFVSGEAAVGIDWRRSARDDRTYIREREWEAAHTVWIWVDRSPSMAYMSDLASQPKLDRALVLGLAAADLLVRGGERVGIPGLVRPMARRTIVDHLAESMLVEMRRSGYVPAEMPPAVPLPPRSRALFISDWLSDLDDVTCAIATAASAGAGGHLVMISDPIEETFPFTGHVELTDSDGPTRMRLGEAQQMRADYVKRLAAHREAIRQTCRLHGWTVAIHRTDRPASEAMLTIAGAFEADRRNGGQV